MFKNIVAFTYPNDLDLSSLEKQVEEVRLKPVGALELSSDGFVAPMGQHDDRLCVKSDGGYWLAHGTQARILPPSSTINAELAKRLDKIERDTGKRPGGRGRKALKEEIIREFLPRTFVRQSATSVLIDTKNHLVLVDTASRKQAESAISLIRSALGSFPALPLSATRPVDTLMTQWVLGNDLPDNIALGEECELRNAEKGRVKVNNITLEADDLERHINNGMQVARLATVFDDRVSVVLGDDLVLRKFALLDAAWDGLQDSDDMASELLARLALFTGEFRQVYAALKPVFGIEDQAEQG